MTQQQFAANQVYKVGGGNDMSPVHNWDWGLRFESANWSSVWIHTVTFQLTAPGLTVAQLVNAANQDWYFGVHVQFTQGPKQQANIGFPVTPPPAGTAPTIAIAAPRMERCCHRAASRPAGPSPGRRPSRWS